MRHHRGDARGYARAVGAQPRKIVASLAGASAGAALAAAAASGSSAQVITLGNASGEPKANICLAMTDCTYVPFAGPGDPALQAPFAGTVTSFSVNAGNIGGEVELRVLRPGAGEKFTGVATSPPETLDATGINTFTVSLRAAKGDVLALDNESSALLFEKVSGGASTHYFEPELKEEVTGVPEETAPVRLLLSAEMLAAPVVAVAPVLSDFAQTHRVWRAGSKPVTISSRAPIGTTFSFALNEQASVRLAFSRRLAGRKVGHRCVAPDRANARRRRCTLTTSAGALTLAGHEGVDRIAFDGRLSATRRLRPGAYSVTVRASNSSGASAAHSLSFQVARA